MGQGSKKIKILIYSYIINDKNKFMYSKIKNIIATILSLAVFVLTIITILSIWGYIEKDISGKSISTIGILVFSSVVVLLIYKVIEDKKQ